MGWGWVLQALHWMQGKLDGWAGGSCLLRHSCICFQALRCRHVMYDLLVPLFSMQQLFRVS